MASDPASQGRAQMVGLELSGNSLITGREPVREPERQPTFKKILLVGGQGESKHEKCHLLGNLGER